MIVYLAILNRNTIRPSAACGGSAMFRHKQLDFSNIVIFMTQSMITSRVPKDPRGVLMHDKKNLCTPQAVAHPPCQTKGGGARGNPPPFPNPTWGMVMGLLWGLVFHLVSTHSCEGCPRLNGGCLVSRRAH